MGFFYIKNWYPFLTPLLTFLIGSFSIFGLINIGKLIKNKLRININNIWGDIINLILGVFTFSLFVQIISFLKLNNKFSLGILAIFLILFGFKKIPFRRLTIPKIDKKSLIPSSILIAIFLVRIFISVIPSTKIDELYYHMLLPLRLLNETGLNFYSVPWEGAIWPHMHYQFIGAPFYAIGLPDSVNIISIGIFITFLRTLFFQINEIIKNKELTLWCLVLFSSGLHSLVDLTTNASNSLLLVSSCSSLLILCEPNKSLPTNDLKSFSLIFGLLSLGMIGSKISMVPIFLVQTFIFLKTIYKVWGGKLIFKSLFYFSLPFILFYLPIVFYTFIKSGSPFGPLLSSLFVNKSNFDPVISSTTGDLGYKGNIKEFIFFCLTKWTPLIWLSWMFFLNKKINYNTKTIFLTILIIQSLMIWLILPDSPRHFAGFQYVGLLIVFVELIPKFFKKFRVLLISTFLFFSVPWLFLDIYYSYPLLTKAFFQRERFKQDYIPFYKDFILLDNLLEKNSEILVYNKRINTFHSPRKVLFSTNEIKKNKNPKYLFLVGDREEKSLLLGKLIYRNENANIYCFRTPYKKCTKDQLRVYKINS